MNAEQRKFLINKIESTFNQQKQDIEKKLPKRPEINNYIVQALLQGGLKIKAGKKLLYDLKEKMLAQPSYELVKSEENNLYGRRYRLDDEDEEEGKYFYLNYPIEEIFELPKEFKAAVKRWENMRQQCRKELADLTAQKDTLVLKIQIGSSKILDRLVAQVDELGSIDLVSMQLKQIEVKALNEN